MSLQNRLNVLVHHQHLDCAAGSSQANPFACIASGIAALWGPAHGGANEAVLRMLEQIGSRDNIPEAIKRAKDKQDSFRYASILLRTARTTHLSDLSLPYICSLYH